MVSWGRSFKAALLLMVFTILWGIVGALIMFGGSLLIPLGAIYIDPSTSLPVIDWGLMIGAGVLWIIGTLIILLGVYASFFKVNTEIIIEGMSQEIEEMKRTTSQEIEEMKRTTSQES
ncbi:MAG: hypothetical protein L6M37_01605 [Candidatus Methylarchaceae archaeon HK02M1]|nr:hypothetical protein [Candidatus Methylarchaceae archaeon HK02M1]